MDVEVVGGAQGGCGGGCSNGGCRSSVRCRKASPVESKRENLSSGVHRIKFEVTIPSSPFPFFFIFFIFD